MESDKIIQPNRRYNLAQLAYREIKDLILQNKLKSGDLLSESLIAQELGMSRTPVREALRVLAQEDLIEILNGIGVYVKDISVSDMVDIFEVRKALEVIAIKSAIHEIKEEDIIELENKFIRFKQNESTEENNGFEGLSQIDWELHGMIVEKCNNSYVKNIMKDIHFNTQRYLNMSINALNNPKQSVEQHLELLKSIKARNIDNTVIILEEHIDWSLDCLIKNIQ